MSQINNRQVGKKKDKKSPELGVGKGTKLGFTIFMLLPYSLPGKPVTLGLCGHTGGAVSSPPK